jgi:hypothetical protein
MLPKVPENILEKKISSRKYFGGKNSSRKYFGGKNEILNGKR